MLQKNSTKPQEPQEPQAQASTLDTALEFIARGWNPVPNGYRAKKPIGEEWQKRKITLDTAAQYFNGEAMNVGVLLGGTSKGLTDVDLDCAETIAVAPYILPHTDAIFGRDSARNSHRLYYTKLAETVAAASVAFDDPNLTGEGARLLDLRIGAEGHGAQTVFPPSIHESGEEIAWEKDGEPALVDGEELYGCAAMVAACALLARYWPPTGSGCHKAALVVGGFLARTGMKPSDVRFAVEAIARANGSDRREEMIRTAEDAVKAHARGEHTYGLPALCGTFGDKVAGKIAEWLEYKGNTNTSAAQGLPDPHPLPDSLLPVDPFDFDLLPDALRPWMADICARMQCPPDYVAVSLMAALGSIIGRKVAIRPQCQDDWTIVCNLWAMLIGRPGVLKNPAMDETLRPTRKLAAAAEEKFKIELATHGATATIAKLRYEECAKRIAKILKDNIKADVSSLLEEDETEEPTLKRYIANDTTVASLGVLLQQNPNGLLVFRDELVSLLDHLDREENNSDKGFYLTAWNGNTGYTFDRIGRGLNLSIPGVCLSMLGSTQPGRIAQYLARAVKGGRGDDGLIQRFGLMVWPDVSPEWNLVDRWPDRDAKAAAMAVFERMDELDWHAIGAKRDRDFNGDEEGLPYLRFGLDAYDLFVKWRTALEARLRSGELHAALEAHLAKYRKLVPALALICHLADGGTGSVGVNSVRRAIAWAKYLESHAQRAYGSVLAAEADTAKAILAKIASGALKGEFGSRDVWRPGWSRLTDREAVAAGLAMLVEYDWLTQRKVETMGRPQTVYTLNPKAKA